MTKLKLSFLVNYPDGEKRVDLVGQYARTQSALVENGSKGITALELSSWALRLSHYVFILRSEYSLDIEMVREEHNGVAGSGWHGRYVLHTPTRLVSECKAS